MYETAINAVGPCAGSTKSSIRFNEMRCSIMPSNLRTTIVIASVVATCLSTSHVQAELRIGNICRVKGQEENTLQGLGLVVGLKGTGDNELNPTLRALAKAMHNVGNSVAKGPKGDD